MISKPSLTIKSNTLLTGNSFKDTILSIVITTLLEIQHKSPLIPCKSPMCTLYQTVQVFVSTVYAFVCHQIPFSIYLPNITHTMAYFLGYFFLININDFLTCFTLSKDSDTQLYTTPLNFYSAVSLLQSTNHIPIRYLFCVYSICSEEARSFLKTSSMPYSEGEVIVEDTLEQKSEDLSLKLMCQQHNLFL